MIIYKVINKITQESYIGKTVSTLAVRKSKHKYDLKRKNSKFYQNIKEYGWDNFDWIIWAQAKKYDTLKQLEKAYIKRYKPELNSKKY